MLVAPVCSAMTALIMFRVFVGAGFGDPAAAAGAVLHQVTFSQMVFGSIPDHFAIGGLGLSIALLNGLVLPARGRLGWLRWLAVGVFTTGITITQIVPTCLMFAAGCRSGGWRARETLRATTLLGGSSVAAALAIGGLYNWLDARPSPLSPVDEVVRYSKFFPRQPWSHARGAIAALPNSIAPPTLRVVPDRRGDSDRYRIRFTLESVRDSGRIAAIWLPFLAGAMLGFRATDPARRALHLGSLAIVLYNLVFHALWGYEWFLYSQHWLAPMVVVIAVPLRDAARHKVPLWVATSVAIALIAAGNCQRIGEIVSRLEAEPRVVAAPVGAEK
jgi:hypothetical protein